MVEEILAAGYGCWCDLRNKREITISRTMGLCHSVISLSGFFSKRVTQVDTDTEPVLSVFICVHLWLFFSKIPTDAQQADCTEPGGGRTSLAPGR
jgi:hypothetical protein